MSSLEKLLAVPARHWLNTLPKPQRARIGGALTACADMLEVMDALELDRFELADRDLPDLSVWNDAAPQVRDALRALHSGATALETLFPGKAASNEVDVDAAFDELVRVGPVIDRWVEESPPDDAIVSLVAMLRQDTATFASKLRDASIVSSRWALVGELQEFKARAVQCIEAIAAALLKPTDQPLAVLLPRYSTELKRSLMLRDALFELGRKVASEDVRTDPDRAAQRLIAHLEALAAEPCYRWLWARDKKALIAARLGLRDYSHAIHGPLPLRHTLDDLTRFLELLVAGVSKRPEVEDYDRGIEELGGLLSA